MKKRLSTGTRVALAAGALVAPPVLHSLIMTCRKIHIGSRQGHYEMVHATPHVVVMWHQRILALMQENASRRAVVMVSQSTDGEIVARAMLRLGYVLARGSSSRGGREALHEMIRLIRQGHMAGFVGDGPRGPAHVLKMGAIIAARDTQTPVCGVTAVGTRSIFARSWDRTEIPLPFSTIVYGYTEPFSVPRDAAPEQLEQARLRVERELNEMDARCEAKAKEIARRQRS
jgi:hypothetical protein